MRFLIDTNILLHSVNSRSEHHARARGFLEQHLAEGTPWCLSWGIIYEFLRVATHARVFPRALSAQQACGYLAVLLERQEVSVLVPTQRHWQLLQKTLNELAHPAGNLLPGISVFDHLPITS